MPRGLGVLPRVLVRIRRTVRRATERRAETVEPVGIENAESWQAMLSRVEQQERARDLAQRLRRTEAALARLNSD
jgi:hypothetical protein